MCELSWDPFGVHYTEDKDFVYLVRQIKSTFIFENVDTELVEAI